jgi:TetR/AcrR family transcriptional regulator, cholesterol catabolism regulator
MTAEEKIINAATEAFMVKGIRSVTMDSIAQAAGVSKRTIYELFKDKDTLVIQTLGEMIISQNKSIIEIIGNTENVIEALFVVMEREAVRRREMSQILIQDIEKYFPLVNAAFFSNPDKICEYSPTYTFLVKGTEQGIIRKDLKIEFVDNFIHELIGLVHTSERLKQLMPDKADFMTNIFMPYFRGICTQKGLSLMEKYFETMSD